MLTDSRITDKDGKSLETVTDPQTGMAFIIGSLKGEVGVSVYFEEKLIREFYITAGGSVKLSDAFKRAAYHGS